ncbi:MAG: hypothetical protein FJZ92_09465 [Chloroflexi bacterium]|nr:hypothetical protein [Chloroflexota bacterium]
MSAIALGVSARLSPRSGWAPRLLAAAAALALLQGSLFVAIDPQLVGWLPDHGHVYRVGDGHAHDHGWDAPARAAAPAAHDDPAVAPGGGASSADPVPVFTPPERGLAGTSVTVPVDVVSLAMPVLPGPARAAPPAPPAEIAAGVKPAVPTPPPRH